MTFKPGDRVRLIAAHDVFELGFFPAGLLGTVVYVDEAGNLENYAGDVRLDAHLEELAEWDNRLQVFGPDGGDITWAAFEKIES